MIGKILENLDPDSMKGVRFLTAISISIIFLFFVWFFIGQIKVVKEGLKVIEIPTWIVQPSLAVVIFVVSILLFSDDVLYYGDPEKNSYVRTFQEKWPSKHLSKKLDIREDLAMDIWFDEFNKWRDEEHPQHQQWKDTLSRGFTCRLVYYLIHCLKIFIWLGILFLIVELFSLDVIRREVVLGASLWLRIIFIVFMLTGYMVLKYTNRLEWKGATGVWRRYNEINERSNHWIDNNIELFKERLEKLREEKSAT